MSQPENLETATLAGGCFWCTEAIIQRLRGVVSVEPGYSGGDIDNPTYEQVSSGKTGHAEAIQIKFDPSLISFEKILDVFFTTHDPTTLNRQGADIGTQYRSAIFYHSDNQKKMSEKVIQNLEKEHKFSNPIITKLEPFKKFYKAENYHKDYYDSNRSAPYCQLVIDPKIQKLQREFQKDII
mgnify:CR=1 FL=1